MILPAKGRLILFQESKLITGLVLTSLGGDESEPGEVSAVASCIAGQQAISRDRRTCAYKEVGQGRTLLACTLAVNAEGFSRKERSLIRNRFSFNQSDWNSRGQIFNP
jgi:hypothetical protein